MCGIAGFFGRQPVPERVQRTILARLASRGPDAQHLQAWNADWHPAAGAAHHALIHARLSIIDPRPIADQPMGNARGDIWICYNGEVYGWQDDARRLEATGAAFRTRSDTEFILRGYEAWGEDVVARLRGMFAFAILDLRRQCLFIARDRMGLKPLVYHRAADGFAFASTVRALLPLLPAEARTPDAEAVDAYLAHRYVPAPRTILRGLRRLPNATALRVDLRTFAVTESRYWRPTPQAGDWQGTLDTAVRLRTVADRPVGIFLSGGIDSTLLATRLAANGCTNIAAYTAAFPGTPFDEAAQARTTAERLGLPHRAVEVPATPGEDFSRIVADLDEPFADPSAFPLWYLAREASREVKVVLAGDGGDELFAGYKRYRAHLRSALRRNFSAPWLPAKGRLTEELSLSWEEAYALRFSGFAPRERRALCGAAVPRATYWRRPEESGRDALQTLLAIDMLNYLPEYILRKGDLCTMAHGLELRAPLLDHEFYQQVLALPPGERFTRPPKLALAPLCPPCSELGLFARPKRGFNPPLDRMLRRDLKDRIPGLGERLAALTAGQFVPDAVNRFAAAYGRGLERHAEKLLQLLVLEESLQQLAEAGA